MILRRRVLAMLFAGLMAVSLAACNGDGTVDDPGVDDPGIGDPGGDLPEEDPLVDS